MNIDHKEIQQPGPFVHYYAFCIFGWCTAPSAKEVAEKMITNFKYDFPGMEDGSQNDEHAKFWVIRVDLPEIVTYDISFFEPVIDKESKTYVVDCPFSESDELLKAL